jgi:hypothetical protein
VLTPTPSAATVVPAPDRGRRARTATLTAPETEAPREPERPVGRHSRDATPAPAPAPTGSGRHAAGRRSAPPVATARTEPVDVERDDDALPDEVDEIAEQMLSQLAATEPRPPVIDFDELPGGKWGVIAGGTVAFIVVVMIASVVLNLLFNR